MGRLYNSRDAGRRWRAYRCPVGDGHALFGAGITRPALENHKRTTREPRKDHARPLGYFRWISVSAPTHHVYLREAPRLSTSVLPYLNRPVVLVLVVIVVVLVIVIEKPLDAEDEHDDDE